MHVIHTPRMILRPFTMADLSDFYEYAQQPDVGPSAGWVPHRSVEESREILARFIEQPGIRAIVYRENGKVIGSIGLHNDRVRQGEGIACNMIGYVLSHDYWGHGLMSEAVRHVLQYCFEELRLDIVSIYHFPFNDRSRRVIEKCGFRYEGCLRMATATHTGQVYDSMCYSMLRGEYEALKAAGKMT